MMQMGIGTALAYLAVQWLIVSGMEFNLDQAGAARALLGVAGAGLVIGVFAGFLSVAINRYAAGRLPAVAISVALLIALEMFAGLETVLTASTVIASLASGILAFLIIIGISHKLPRNIGKAGFWWGTAASAFTAALGLSAINSVDTTGLLVSLGGAGLAACLLVYWWLDRSDSILIPVVTTVLVFAASAVLGNRVPVYAPDTAVGQDRTSVLLITVDTLRADHVGVYGHKEARTPHLDGLAAEGILFRQVVANNVMTGASHASLLSGLLPEKTGVLTNMAKLDGSVPTLSDFLRKEGYVTGAFVSGFTAVDSACGLPSRFRSYDDDIRAFRWWPNKAYRIAVLKVFKKLVKFTGWHKGVFGQPYRMGSETADVAVAWLDKNGGRPFFVWTHFFDPHIPYRSHKEFQPLIEGEKKTSSVTGEWYELDAAQQLEIATSPEKIAEMKAMYDAEIAYADAQVGRVIDAARRAAPSGELLIVVTSDHGESMGEHKIYWSRNLYDPSLMVPLIVVPPNSYGLTHHEVAAQVQLVDLVPTILELIDVSVPLDFDGNSLVDLLGGKTGNSTGPAFSGYYPIKGVPMRGRQSVRDDGWKLIRHYSGWEGQRFTDEIQELFNLDADPAELDDLIDSQLPILGVLENKLGSHKLSTEVQDISLTPEEQDRLRSLGYIR